MSSDVLDGFASRYPFAFDDFQVQACRAVADGRGVLVASPTGSGKTVVGEFAVWQALRERVKCFYTTPIKALSNQKYHDLVAKHGVHRVGLLTGDVSINSEAPILVMTTEVLRNMLYAHSSTLSGLGYVVLDEVHYLADRFRGAVWEEVILGLPARVQVIALSATVSNAEEFGEWLGEVRGDVAVVVSEHRPVPLYQHVMVDDRLVDLFAAPEGIPAPPRVNPFLTRLAASEARQMRDDARRPRGRSGNGRRHSAYGSGQFGGAPVGGSRAERQGGRSGPRHAPSRASVVATLSKSDLLPAIVFVFSRQGCDAAVRQLLRSGVRLTTRDERRELLEIAERHGSGLEAGDREALGWSEFCEALGRGVAAHHAGALPVFKAIVEEGFTRGLLKVVYATETLALGVNMPARTVVIEKLVKYNGEEHVDLTPGEYTQLTGRAGRRGIDHEGHAVVLWQPGMDPRAVAGLAAARSYPLHSSFAPTYNMAVNLVGTLGRPRARQVLEQSFAQFQADRSVVRAAREGVAQQELISQLWQQAACDRGDFVSYARTRARVGELEAEAARARRQDRRAEILAGLSQLEPGDLIQIGSGRHAGWAAVIAPGKGAVRQPVVMTQEHRITEVGPDDFQAPVVARSRVRISPRFDVHSAADRKALARALDARVDTLADAPQPARTARPPAELDAEIEQARAQLRAHPCHDCPERETHARFAEQALRLERQQETRSSVRTGRRRRSIADQFDRICGVLDSLGYLDPQRPPNDEVTEAGRTLARIYNDLDLVVTESLRGGVFAGLSAPQLAGLLSSLVYESRRADTGQAMQMPDPASEAAESALWAVWRQVSLVERDYHIERGRVPDSGFALAAYEWARGVSLADLLAETELEPGDVVRWIRQIIDLAGQIATAPGVPVDVVTTCRRMTAVMRRDIVELDPSDAE